MKTEHSESMVLSFPVVFYKMKNFMLMLIGLLLVNVNVSTLALSSNDKEVIEKTNNVVIEEGYVIENFIYKEKKLYMPIDIKMSRNGNLYVLLKNKILKMSGKNIIEEIAIDSKAHQGIRKLAIDSHENIFALKDNNLILKINKGETNIFASFDKDQTFLSDIVIDRQDNIYLSDLNKSCVYKFTPRSEKNAFLGKRFGFRKPMSITVDANGRLYVLDVEQKKIFEIIPKKGKISLFADVSCVGNPYVIRSDNNGSFLYLVDKDNNLLYSVSKFNVTQQIAIFSKWHMLSGGITLDAVDNIYLTTGGKSNRIVRLSAKLSPTFLVGPPRYLFFDTDYGVSCRDYFVAYKSEFHLPDGIAFDLEGNLYIVNEGGGSVIKIDNNKHIEVLATKNDGLRNPGEIAINKNGNIYISDKGACKVFCIDKDNRSISVYADEKFGLKKPEGIAFDKEGNLFIADETRGAIIKITADKKIEIFADTSNGLNIPENIAIDDQGLIYVSDRSQGKIFRFTPDGKGYVFADESCGLKGPEPIALDKNGNLFVGDEETSKIYEFKPNGEGRVYAELATRTLRFLAGLAFSPAGQLYVTSAEIGASRIFKIEPKKVTFKESGEESEVRKGHYQLLKPLSRKDGLYKPSALAKDKKGQLFISDEVLGVVFLYSENKLIPYIKIKNMRAAAITFDRKGNLYILDDYSGNVYVISPSKDIKIILNRKYSSGNFEEIMVDEENNIYIADETVNKIFKIKNGCVETFMDDSDGIGGPEKIICHNGFLYIANRTKGDILIADMKGKPISRFYIRDAEGITFDKKGNIYVTSDSESKLYMINKQGRKVVIADFYDGLRHPASVEIDKEENLIVADEVAGCIFKLIPKRNNDKK